MDEKINSGNIPDDEEVISEEHIDYKIDKNTKVIPTLEAFRIIMIYSLLGAAWIFITDYLLINYVHNSEIQNLIQLYKGWFYVIITAFIFFLIINRRINLVKQSAGKIIKAYSEVESANNKLEKIAYIDPLTCYPNRNSFEREVKKKIFRSRKFGIKFALIIIDIDNFRYINNFVGNIAGDKLLTDYSLMFADFAGENDYFARIGGDEFGFLFEYSDRENLFRKVDNILIDTEKIWEYSDIEFFITVSIGVSFFPEHGNSYNVLMKSADTALYNAKDTGKNCYSVFSEDMLEDTVKYISLSTRIKKALENDLLKLHYQPVINLKTGNIAAIEALVRLPGEDLEFIPNSDFIPFAESTGLIFKIDEWVIENACKQKKSWNDKGLKNIKLLVNLSGKSLSMKNISAIITKSITGNGLSFGEIEFEITETAVIDNFENSIEVLQDMKIQGINLTLDDFGIGYSSLTYLQKLPVDIVKIDRKFLLDVKYNSTHSLVFKAVVELAHDLKLKVVAEGIETKEQMDFAGQYNCDYVQGYYFERPLPEEDAEKLFLSKIKYF